MMCTAEVRITAMDCTGILGTFNEELLQSLGMVQKEFVLQTRYAFGFVFVDLQKFFPMIEKIDPVITVKLFGHIKWGSVTGGTEFGDDPESPGVISLCGRGKCQSYGCDHGRCNDFFHFFSSRHNLGFNLNCNKNLCIHCVADIIAL